MLERGLRRRFDPLVEREARIAASEPAGERVDLRELPTFTIDPPTARDFDDAISAEELPDGAVRVWVHIADVAAYVRPGSALDREAFRRANSVYVPGLVEPMLPEALSNRACSLVPGEDRLAVTVELEFEGAKVRRTAFHRSLIRSDERLDYPRWIASSPAPSARAEPWAKPLAAAREGRGRAGRRRARRAARWRSSLEPEFGFSRDGHVETLLPSEQTESHQLIEFLMIAANEAVASLLETRKLPALFRVHEPPEPARVERLLEQLAALGVPTPPVAEHLTAAAGGRAWSARPRGSSTPRSAAVARARGVHVAGPAVLEAGALLAEEPRPLRPALAALLPLHLADPPLSGPDLPPRAAERDRRREATVRASDLEAAGEWCSARERDAMAIERAADNVARAFLLERRAVRGARLPARVRRRGRPA